MVSLTIKDREFFSVIRWISLKRFRRVKRMEPKVLRTKLVRRSFVQAPSNKPYKLKTIKAAFHHLMKWSKEWNAFNDTTFSTMMKSLLIIKHVRVRLHTMMIGFMYFQLSSKGLDYLRIDRLSSLDSSHQFLRGNRVTRPDRLLRVRLSQLLTGLKKMRRLILS